MPSHGFAEVFVFAVGRVAAGGEEGLDEAAQAAFIKAAGNLAQGFGISQGLPVSGVKELGRVFGIGDDDGEFDLYWQAILGRRKQQ